MAGVSGRVLTARMKAEHGLTMSQGTVWRIDNAETLPALVQVQAWLRVSGADGATRERVLELLGQAHRESPAWSRRLAGQEHLQRQAADRERASVRVRNFQPTVVPGLLQTTEYARHVLSRADVTGDTDVAAALAVRLERQAILHEPGRRFEFLIPESVLWATLPTPGAMVAQHERLVEAAGLPSIDLAIRPLSAVVDTTWHGFALHEADDGTVYAASELLTDYLEIRARADVAMLETRWTELWAAAVVGDEARVLLEQVAERYG